MKKILIVAILLAVVGVTFAVNSGETKNKPYYSGKAVNYNGRVFIGSTNSGAFELFALENGQIYKKTAIQSSDRESKEFYDLLFDKADGKLYVYLVNGRSLYRYDVSNPVLPVLDKKIQDNSWDWFSRVLKVNGRLATIGSKGVKIWNNDFQVIDGYQMINNNTLGTANFSEKGGIAFSVSDKVAIYNTATREKVAEYSIAVNDTKAKREAINDSDRSLIYVVDDKSLKAIDLTGAVKQEFKHISHTGYDVVPSSDPNYIYFSDGVGVVKIDKETFKPVKWAYTTGAASGSWAMGLAAVNDGASEKLVVFNGAGILVLDGNMNKVAFYESIEKDLRPMEDLALNADKTFGAPGTQVLVHGQGFGLGEDLVINFAKETYKAKTDANGRFETIIAVPTSLPTGTDIKVTGKDSKRTYSIAFRIE